MDRQRGTARTAEEGRRASISGAALSRLRAALAPHWSALLALALFLVAGLAVLDDYGLTLDETWQRQTGLKSIRFVLGDWDALPMDHNRFYGVVFEAPLLLAERALGLTDSRGVYLARHLLIHLAFLAGGLFAYLLAFRLFGARFLALLAMALFLLHPRLYAHSFFNSKDIPFLVLFMVTLFLTHRALKKGGLPVFVLLGAAAGALVNLRIMGLILVAAIPAMRALDFAFAQGWAERRRIAMTTAAFGLSCAIAVFASLPYLWADPFGRAAEWWATLSQHPTAPFELFRGTLYRSVDFPPEYLPFWFSIASPPFALLLGAAGAVVAFRRSATAIGEAFRNTRLRFALALAACCLLPLLAVALLDFNIANGWRHMYFLWAPFSLLGVFGLRRLASAFRQARWRVAVYGAAGAGLTATLISMALIHPNEQVYFNFLVDRAAPERLRSQYAMDYWRHPDRQAIERLLDQNPSRSITANTTNPLGYLFSRTFQILPRTARARISGKPGEEAFAFAYGPPADESQSVYALKVYGNTIASVARKPDLRAAYAAAKASEPIVQSRFDVHHVDGALIYVKEPCGEAEITDSDFMLRVVPERSADIPDAWRAFEYEDRSFHFPGHGALFDGKCVALVPLPDYPVAAVRTGQWTAGPTWIWESDAALHPDRWRAEHQAVEDDEPAARGAFDVYFADGALIYLREPCEAADAEDRFFLHLVPERADDLPEARRRHGFDNLDFDFYLRGARFDGKCLARAELPGYPVAAVRTGQYGGEGQIWSVTAAVGDASAAENDGGA